MQVKILFERTILLSFNAASGNAMMQVISEPRSLSIPQFQCRKRQCYDASKDFGLELKVIHHSFNAASGNAMMQGFLSINMVGHSVFQCRKRQCYDASSNWKKVSDAMEFQCRKRQCYDASRQW